MVELNAERLKQSVQNAPAVGDLRSAATKTDELAADGPCVDTDNPVSNVEGFTCVATEESDSDLLRAAGYTPSEIVQTMEKCTGGDNDLVHHPFLLHSDHALPCMAFVPENLGCSLDCGQPDPRQVVVSDFLSSRRNIFGTVLSLRKDVIDYVFSSPVSVNVLEPLVVYTDIYFIPREDMITLLPGTLVTNSVIECWCILLNSLTNSNDVPFASTRCFFGLSHAGPAIELWQAKLKGQAVDLSSQLFSAWDLWIESCFSPFRLDADMVFIPVLSSQNDHYSCACVNFLSEQIEYLDNRYYDDDYDKIPYTWIARALADAMGKYLVSKGVEKGSKVSGFKFVNVPFSWQGVGVTNGDCGVYMMLHMLLYAGSPFDCGLGSEDTNDIYRAEIAAVLILSDINKCRGDVLSKVSSFLDSWKTPRRMSKEKKSSPPKSEHKRLLDDDDDCLVTYKRCRVTTPVEVLFTSEEPVSVLRSRPRGKGDGLGCSLDCGPASGLDILVVSNFLRNNQTLCKNVLDLRKHVADYGFLDDTGMPSIEVLARYGPNAKVQRDDITSMLPDVSMSSFVIECWAMLLNRIESDGFHPARMAFFGLRHTDALMRILNMPTQCTPGDGVYDMLYAVWDVFIIDCGNTINLDAKFIFIPIEVDGHIACACINFNSKTVDILDNKIHVNPGNSIIFKAASILTSAMSDYLEYKGITAAKDIPSFEHRQIMFDWVRPPALDEESGIFTMVYMLMYEGHTFKHSDLDGKKNRWYLVVQLAATLILADANVERDEVMEKINKWIINKDKLWTDIQARRRISKIIAKSTK